MPDDRRKPESIEERDARWRRDHPEYYPADALFDDRYAMMSRASFDALHDYSCTVPTGVVPGKCWKRRKRYGGKRRQPRDYLVGRYDPKNETRCTIVFREVLIVG